MSNSNNLVKNKSIEVKEIAENERYRRFSRNVYSIRAISMFSIIIYHIGSWFTSIYSNSPILLRMFYSFCFIGIDLFFFLSGMMLVVNILQRDDLENHSWNEWYKRRILRIFPEYWIMYIIILLLISFITTNFYFDLSRILINFSGFQMIPIENPNFVVIHFIYWFITALLLCYLLCPLFFFMIRRNLKATLIISMILFVVFVFYTVLTTIETINEYIIMFFIAKFFVFLFGMTFGYWIGENNMENLEKIYNPKVGLCFFIILVGAFIIFFIIGSNYIFMLPMISVIIIILLLFVFNKFDVANKPLVFFGKRSYEIYLNHSISYLFLEFIFFRVILLPKNLTNELILLPIFLSLTFVFAIILNIVINKINNLKKIHPYIIVLAISFFLYALVALFLFFFINIFLALIIYTSILLSLVIVCLYKKRREILKTSEL